MGQRSKSAFQVGERPHLRAHSTRVEWTALMASRRLLRAASTGDVDAVDALIREGADPGFQVRVPPTKRPVTMSTPAPSNTSHNPLIIPTAAHPRLLLPTARTGPQRDHAVDAGVRARTRGRRPEPPRRRSAVVSPAPRVIPETRDHRAFRKPPPPPPRPSPRPRPHLTENLPTEHQERVGQRRALRGGVRQRGRPP